MLSVNRCLSVHFELQLSWQLQQFNSINYFQNHLQFLSFEVPWPIAELEIGAGDNNPDNSLSPASFNSPWTLFNPHLAGL